VIIVDDSEGRDTEKLITDLQETFRIKGICLSYIRNFGKKGLAPARNVGFEYSKGEIIVFLDDDVILSSNYIGEILKAYSTHVDAIGVQGYIVNAEYPRRHSVHVVSKIFLMHHFDTECRILPPFTGTYPYAPKELIRCEWLSGCNHSWKRWVLERFKFDEDLLGPSIGEDKDFSYRVHKAKLGSLYLVPTARIIHNSLEKHEKSMTEIQEIYKLYLFCKNIDQTLKNWFTLIWHNLGKWLLLFIPVLKKPNYRNARQIITYLNITLKTLTRLRDIRRGNLEFLNKKLRTKLPQRV